MALNNKTTAKFDLKIELRNSVHERHEVVLAADSAELHKESTRLHVSVVLCFVVLSSLSTGAAAAAVGFYDIVVLWWVLYYIL